MSYESFCVLSVNKLGHCILNKHVPALIDWGNFPAVFLGAQFTSQSVSIFEGPTPPGVKLHHTPYRSQSQSTLTQQPTTAGIWICSDSNSNKEIQPKLKMVTSTIARLNLLWKKHLQLPIKRKKPQLSCQDQTMQITCCIPSLIRLWDLNSHSRKTEDLGFWIQVL